MLSYKLKCKPTLQMARGYYACQVISCDANRPWQWQEGTMHAKLATWQPPTCQMNG